MEISVLVQFDIGTGRCPIIYLVKKVCIEGIMRL